MKNCMSFAKGLGVGIILGATATVMYKCACQNSRTFRKKTSKAAKAVSDIIDDLKTMME